MTSPATPLDRLAPRRAAWLQRLLPDGVPRLWCPLLTPYTAQGAIDAPRLQAHLRFLQPHVRGLLVPGSTGDGWQLADDEGRTLLQLLMDQAPRLGLHLLVGVLKPGLDDMLATLADLSGWLHRRAGMAASADGASDDTELARVLRHSGVCGFTVCPPHGAGLTQDEIATALDRLLATGLPMALYQLPQVTGNEMAPQTVAALADRHANLLMLKDTSGADRVAAAGFRQAFLVRGAEGGYSRHLAAAGGDYDGFLLSTANVFAPQLAALLAHLDAGQQAQADALSARLQAVVEAVFAAAAPVPWGNAFTNANKALDHFMAHGPQAEAVPGPRLHSGHLLPPALISAAGQALRQHALMPARGYLG
ncbi:dihydrodipicolinate synthase family protein [Aquincola tertiaricarbonis]|uniref:Dihydrodipicolinate synthase family protein n=1 Tax=Aquincola tertiaricarbonis TaxID=391953 RepID=A0ABY4S0P5_AQUTE|nr:dihydrodipicolinate synthase family protein [Aquincola tertiaricarbonis]URI06085.1 dihydrodipicolinate synthase family protein [Aquincola tertiaricarbonis]